MTTTRRAQNPLPPLAIRAWLRYDVVRRLLADISPKTVLEVGCGQGAMGARIACVADYLGVEPDPVSFAIASRRIDAVGGRVLNCTSSDLPDEQLFDVVCAFEVLEHIEDDSAALAEWRALTRPGGTILLSVPAFAERFGPMDRHAGHFRRYEPEQLRELLHEHGFEDVEVIVYGWPLGYALEAVRNRMDARLLNAEPHLSMHDLTAASGRLWQPRGRVTGLALATATAPWRAVQRLRPDRGTGLVARARRP